MEKYLLLLWSLFCTSLATKAQDKEIHEVLKGTIGGKNAITMFLYYKPHPCDGHLMLEGIYKYDKTPGDDSWILLNIESGELGRHLMVEKDFTGVLFLQRKGNGFEGSWIDPDGKHVLPVELKQKTLSEKEMKRYIDIYDETNHRYNDC
ncbi:hypothetical protein HHL16_24725 [Pseudoflavitalea sp. G-6-1-2]|uniref:hypothetical protein n=1 Tax=Pseudoflavitalea sp. G-6-1-2 TaxID=2728841 RepID=UPI00146CD5F2|nr:hypothetical protein [Pseudoflavitalea sp. G-6-1-2]NML24106.1 hypothetical protein [Pseudoflavitalea sp. G-6-1-2]